MNCARFQNHRFEYVEGTLSPGVRAAADQHLARCSACRQALRQERHLARRLSESVRRGTETLALRPGVSRRILRVLETQATPLTTMDFLRRLWNGLGWPRTLAACLFLMVALLIANSFHRSQVHGIAAEGSADRNAHAAEPPAGATPLGSPDRVLIELSYGVPTCRSRAEGNFVIDSLSFVTITAQGTLWIGGQEPVQKRPKKNLPL